MVVSSSSKTLLEASIPSPVSWLRPSVVDLDETEPLRSPGESRFIPASSLMRSILKRSFRLSLAGNFVPEDIMPSCALSSSNLLNMNSGLLPRLPAVAAVCLRTVGGCGGDVLSGAAIFFLESQANGLESFRDIADGMTGLEGGAVVEETDCARFEVR